MRETDNHFQAQNTLDGVLWASGALRSVAVIFCPTAPLLPNPITSAVPSHPEIHFSAFSNEGPMRPDIRIRLSPCCLSIAAASALITSTPDAYLLMIANYQ